MQRSYGEMLIIIDNKYNGWVLQWRKGVPSSHCVFKKVRNFIESQVLYSPALWSSVYIYMNLVKICRVLCGFPTGWLNIVHSWLRAFILDRTCAEMKFVTFCLAPRDGQYRCAPRHGEVARIIMRRIPCEWGWNPGSAQWAVPPSSLRYLLNWG